MGFSLATDRAAPALLGGGTAIPFEKCQDETLFMPAQAGPLYGAAEGQEAAPPSRRNRAAAITASASAITASATAALAAASASAASTSVASARCAASPRASTRMTINSPAHATTATTGPAATVTINAKEKLNTISQITLVIIMDVKSAGTASTLPRTRSRSATTREPVAGSANIQRVLCHFKRVLWPRDCEAESSDEASRCTPCRHLRRRRAEGSRLLSRRARHDAAAAP